MKNTASAKLNVLIMIFLFLLPMESAANAAVYKGKSLDGKNFSATIRQVNTEICYRVRLVMRKKAANLVFDSNQVLPAIPRNGLYLTLYLLDEEISNPKDVRAKLVFQPEDPGYENLPPEKWPALSIWIISIPLEQIKTD